MSQIYTNNEILVKPVHFLRFSYRFSVKIGLKADKIHKFHMKTCALVKNEEIKFTKEVYYLNPAITQLLSKYSFFVSSSEPHRILLSKII